MSDAKFDQLKAKYQSVMNLMQQQGVRLDNVNMAGDKLYVKGEAPSDAIKNEVWNQVKLVDPNFSDLTLDLSAPPPAQATAVAAAAGGGTALMWTEQGAYLDGFDGPQAPQLREGGTADMLDGLAEYLA